MFFQLKINMKEKQNNIINFDTLSIYVKNKLSYISLMPYLYIYKKTIVFLLKKDYCYIQIKIAKI